MLCYYLCFKQDVAFHDISRKSCFVCTKKVNFFYHIKMANEGAFLCHNKFDIFSSCANILDYTFDYCLRIMKLKKLNNSIDVGIIYKVINNIGLTAQYSDIS